MQTSCFSRYTGDKGVAICLYPPKHWKGVSYLDLAPDKSIFLDIKAGRIGQEEYAELYRERTLAYLSPTQVYADLKDKVLLCWEMPIFDLDGKVISKGSGFCHRHIFSKWLSEILNISIHEWRSPKEIEQIKNSIQLF